MTAATPGDEMLSVLKAACTAAGLDPDGAALLRLSENAIFKLVGGVVARISRPRQQSASQREVDVARWLEASGIPAVQVISGVEQPVEIGGRSVTFWKELPPHHHGTPAQVAAALKQLHGLAPSADFVLGEMAPFVRREERIEAATILSDDDRRWMLDHLAELRQRWAELPEGLPWRVIHG